MRLPVGFVALLSYSVLASIPADGFVHDVVLKESKPLAALFSGALYALYCHLIHKYSENVVRHMQDVPSPDMIRQNATLFDAEQSQIILSSNLRKSVSKLNNVVTKLEDRMTWNRWIAKEESSKVAIKKSDILSICGIVYQFKYRTYANYEEVSAICKPFFTWKRFLFTFQKPGIMQFSDPEEGEDKNVVAIVKIQDHFLVSTIIPVHVSWFGKVVKKGKKLRIVWTSAKLEKYGILKKVIVENPPASMELLSIPWDIEKIDDGMICFRRGDVGYLVYDSK